MGVRLATNIFHGYYVDALPSFLKNQKNKSMIKSLLLFTVMTTLLSLTTSQPDKKYKAEATFNDWNLVLKCINNPDDVSKNNRDYVTQLIVSQINKQIQEPPKKDSTLNSIKKP